MTHFRLLSCAVLLTIATQAPAATYVWEAQKSGSGKALPKVTLLNQAVLEEARGASLFEQSVTLQTPSSKQKTPLVKNDLAQIEAAYPNAQNAAAVLLSDNCSGTICDWKSLTLVLPAGAAVKSYPVDSPARITLTISGDQVTAGRADGIPAGEDKYGSRLTTSRQFLPGAGFVAAGFRPEYAALVGEHPERFFDNPTLREPLAKAAGLDNFRDLRRATAVASPSYLVQGRYLVLQGCVAHDCGGNYGFVMIDGVTADVFWARYSEGSNRYAGATRKLDRAALQAVLSDSAFVQNEDAPLFIAPTGKLQYKAGAR
ncbi:MAG: hypothetical protein ACEQSK_05180 [Sphingomonadaceae bacterium]